MTNHLQALLDEIETEALHKSAMAVAGERTIADANALHERLREAGCDACITHHYHYDRLKITIHDRAPEFLIALAACDIYIADLPVASTSDESIYLKYRDDVEIRISPDDYESITTPEAA